MPLPDEVFAASSNPAVPGGSLAKPLIIALLALLAARKFGSHSEEQPDFSLPKPSEETKSSSRESSTDESPEVVSDGLGELAEQFRKSGLGEIIDYWINPGTNKGIEKKEVSHALDGDLVDELARRSGLSRDQVLDGLAGILPDVVDKLTPEGRLPSQQDLFRLMS